MGAPQPLPQKWALSQFTSIAGTNGGSRTDRVDAWRKNHIGVKLRNQDKVVRSPLDLRTTVFTWPLVRLRLTLLINRAKK